MTSTVSPEDNAIRLDKWFKRHYPDISHNEVEKALRKGQIRVNGSRAKANYRIQTGDTIRVPPLKASTRNEKTNKEKIPHKYIELIQNSIIYQDQDIIAINKPYDLPVQGGNGVKISVDDLLEYLKFDQNNKPKLVHRIDRHTSGVLLLARTANIAEYLTKLFKSKQIEKKYIALVVGNIKPRQGKIDLPLAKVKQNGSHEKMQATSDGSKALTRYTVLENVANHVSLVQLQPITGRTHQLRVHLHHIGHPIIGDGKYAGAKAFIDGAAKKLHLHSHMVEFTKPNGVVINISAPMPEHIKQSLENFGIDSKYTL